MNAEFEEWVEEMLDAESNGDVDTEFVVREAYKIGLQRGYDCSVDTKSYSEVSIELSELNKEDK